MTSELIEALRQQLEYLQNMNRHLSYSHRKVDEWWVADADFDAWNDAQLESLAAFKARFAELQDHLAHAMKLVAQIEGEDTRRFTYVLNYMVQLGVLGSMEKWLKVRDLRNAATHDYSKPSNDKARHFDDLLRHADYLHETLDGLRHFAATAYPEANKED